MDEEDRAVEWSTHRRRRTFLVGSVLRAVVALVALIAMLLYLNWAAGFLGSSAALSVMMLLRSRGDRRAARDHTGSFLEEGCETPAPVPSQCGRRARYSHAIRGLAERRWVGIALFAVGTVLFLTSILFGSG